MDAVHPRPGLAFALWLLRPDRLLGFGERLPPLPDRVLRRPALKLRIRPEMVGGRPIMPQPGQRGGLLRDEDAKRV